MNFKKNAWFFSLLFFFNSFCFAGEPVTDRKQSLSRTEHALRIGADIAILYIVYWVITKEMATDPRFAQQVNEVIGSIKELGQKNILKIQAFLGSCFSLGVGELAAPGVLAAANGVELEKFIASKVGGIVEYITNPSFVTIKLINEAVQNSDFFKAIAENQKEAVLLLIQKRAVEIVLAKQSS